MIEFPTELSLFDLLKDIIQLSFQLSQGCYLDEWLIHIISQVDPCTYNLQHTDQSKILLGAKQFFFNFGDFTYKLVALSYMSGSPDLYMPLDNVHCRHHGLLVQK